MITRKRFLLLGSFGILSTLIPEILFSKTLFYSGVNDSDIKVLLTKAKRYRKQKKYNLAKITYEEVLALDPSEIRAYNGIRRILLDKKNMEYEVILLYQKALVNLPNNIKLKYRLYNEYFKASIGNKKIIQNLNIPGRALTYIRDKYEELLKEHPEKKSIQNQLNKINKYIYLNVDTENPHNNNSLKSYRREQKKNFKNRFNGINSQQALNKLSILESKPFSEDRKRHIREMQKVTIKALRKEKKYADALDLSSSILNNNLDPYFIKHFRSLAKQQKQYDKLLSFEIKNHNSKRTFWSAIALFDAQVLNSEYFDTLYPNLSNLLDFIENKASTPNELFEVITRKIKNDIVKNNLTDAKLKIITQCKDMIGTSNTHDIDRMNVIVAKFCKKEGNNNLKSQIVNIALNPKSFVDNDNDFIRILANLNVNRNFKKSIHIQNLQKKINSI